MRYDAEHKERVHQQILAEAAGAIRTKGPDRVGVAEVMARLNLTHGGFYAHFASKDDLVAEAIAYMFEQNVANFVKRTQGREPAAGMAAYIDFYLSPAHRDATGRGCAVAALSGDLPRLPDAARSHFTQGVERLRSGIEELLRKMGKKDAAVLASSVMAELVGALAISRAVLDRDRSDTLLRASRESIKARLGCIGPG
jgi:TetR/AcrR family transcriptional repressor of nem operon